MMTSHASRGHGHQTAWPETMIVAGAYGLLTLAHLSAAKLRDLKDLEVISAKRVIRRDVKSPPRLSVVVSGWACRRRILADGRQQILSLIMPGDFLRCTTSGEGVDGEEIFSLTSVQLIDAARFLDDGDPSASDRVQLALQRAAQVGEHLLLNQIVRMGRLSARERMAHLLLELHDRLDGVGLIHGDSYILPLSQETIADITGLSIVHVNRVLQQLRREGLIVFASNKVTLLSKEVLARLANYQPLPTYTGH